MKDEREKTLNGGLKPISKKERKEGYLDVGEGVQKRLTTDVANTPVSRNRKTEFPFHYRFYAHLSQIGCHPFLEMHCGCALN